MAIAPIIDNSRRIDTELDDEQSLIIFELEKIIDNQLKNGDGISHEYIDIQIRKPVPKIKILLILSDMYRKAGWKDFILSKNSERHFEAFGFWTLRLRKHAYLIPGSNIDMWRILRND